MRPVAIVMNVFYTGLGIARSLGERGIRVIGLSSKPGIFGNYTRYARVLRSPDSRTAPEQLATFLVRLAEDLEQRAVIFPTRDDDLVFLDRFRAELAPFFSPVLPESGVLKTCLNKWDTYLAATAAGIPTPRSWMVAGLSDLTQVLQEVRYPCVLKPVCAYHWRQNANWELVGSRKAFAVQSEEELRAEYRNLCRADERVLVQEMVSGSDDALIVAACYLDRKSKWIAGFNAKKLLQIPERFGTGCIVQGLERPALFEPTRQLLEAIGYSGIAEVEYKWDAGANEYKLIEINPRPWDQHRLGNACGVDLMHLAYCDHAGIALPAVKPITFNHKWVAEDTFVTAVLRSLWRRDRSVVSMLRMVRGKRIYAIWSWKDPLPFLWFLGGNLPRLVWIAISRIAGALVSRAHRQSPGVARGVSS